MDERLKIDRAVFEKPIPKPKYKKGKGKIKYAYTRMEVTDEFMHGLRILLNKALNDPENNYYTYQTSDSLRLIFRFTRKGTKSTMS
jgi:hypothetical protein